jgi:AAA+ ATPase superfamily predicted ATPase
MIARLSTKERVLLYLMEYVQLREQLRFSGTGSIPLSVTQTGIADAVSVSRAHVSRVMNVLEDEALVIGKRAHVKGMKRRTTVYFLTDNGITCAGRIKESFQDKKPLSKPYSSDTEIVGFKPPKLEYFLGRRNELKSLRGWMESDTQKIIVIYGVAGIGKTAVASKIAEEYKTVKNIFWYRLHSFDTLNDVLNAVSIFLYNLDKRRLYYHLATKGNVEIKETLRLLEDGMKDVQILLVFDDFHKANKDITVFFSLFLEILRRITPVKVIIITRHLPAFYNRSDVFVKKIVGELQMSGLDEKNSEILLTYRNIDIHKQDFKKIYDLTGGHPLCLELIETNKMFFSIERYLAEEIFSTLTKNEKRILSIVSGFTTVKTEMVITKNGDYETLNMLIKKSLIKRNAEGYRMENPVKTFFYNTLSHRTRKK